jgi:dephospho-CoA kinase
MNQDKFYLIGILGRLNSGKGTVSARFERRGFARVAFADPLKQTVYDLFEDVPREALWGPSEKRTDEVREMLQQLGTEYARKFRPNIWVDKTRNNIRKYMRRDYRGVVVSDVRFHNEVQMLRDQGGIIIKIIRPENELKTKTEFDFHLSETESDTIPDSLIDYKIVNAGTLDELEATISSIVERID